jgi:hypothetical protein
MQNGAGAVSTLMGQRERSEFGSAFWGCVRADAPLYLAIAVYSVIGMACLELAGFGHLAAYSTYLSKWLTVFLFFFPTVALVLHYGLLIHRFDQRRLLAAKRIFAARRAAYFASGVCLVMSLMIFQGTFTSVKNGLAAWQAGFPYERAFADLDKMLHLGVDPWRLLFAVGQYDWLLRLVEWNYGVLWFIICYGALFYVATSAKAAAVRNRYLVTFMLTWIVIGNIAAGIFLCAGPAFYGQVTGDAARFGDQLAFLARHADYDGSAAYYQNYLWMLYEKGVSGFGSGISAFPSMHVALIMLNALFLWERSRAWGIVAFGYVAFIVVSSVYLAWHYAVDSYAAIAMTIAIYLLVRKWLPDAGQRKARTIGAAPHGAISIAPSAQPSA